MPVQPAKMQEQPDYRGLVARLPYGKAGSRPQESGPEYRNRNKLKARNTKRESQIDSVDPATFQSLLLIWFDKNQRDLPWRRRFDPYAIWLSEVMLQQTRAEVVRNRYTSFLERFPDMASLAAANEEEVLAAWSGLGYYRRARNLHAAARWIVERHEGLFPQDPAAATALPGIGRYTAHAVLSIAYQLPLAAVDGNASRVLSRLCLLPTRSVGRVWEEADRLLDAERPGHANQALMELGAMVCLPVKPACARCPVAIVCAAHRSGRVSEFPPVIARPQVKSERTTIWIVRDRRGWYWLEHREIAPLSGLWMLPWRAGDAMMETSLAVGSVSHAIMNRRYRCEIYETAGPPRSIPGASAGPGEWVASEKIDTLPHSSLLRKCLRLVPKGPMRSFGQPRSSVRLMFRSAESRS